MSGRTVLIRSDILPGYGFLLRYLVLEVFLSLLKHVELFAESQDCFFGRIAALLRGLATEPGPHLAGVVYIPVLY